MTGKGSAPRPFSVSQDVYSLRWDIAFKPMSQAERDVLKARLAELEAAWDAALNKEKEWATKEWDK